MTKKVFFNEDDYCQIELLPIGDLEYCHKEMDALNDFADKSDNIEGFDEIYTREEIPFPLSSLNINTESLYSLLKKVATPFDIVETGYGSFKEEYPQTKAFGLSNELVLFYDYEDDIVQNIWLILEISNAKQRTAASRMLKAMAELHPLLLVDWNCDTIISLTDEAGVDEYLEDISE